MLWLTTQGLQEDMAGQGGGGYGKYYGSWCLCVANQSSLCLCVFTYSLRPAGGHGWPGRRGLWRLLRLSVSLSRHTWLFVPLCRQQVTLPSLTALGLQEDMAGQGGGGYGDYGGGYGGGMGYGGGYGGGGMGGMSGGELHASLCVCTRTCKCTCTT